LAALVYSNCGEEARMTAKDRSEQNLSNIIGWAAAAGQEAQLAARRRRMLSLRLSEADRSACTEDLAEQYALGRLDDAEFGRRLDLLNAAVTHGDLAPVYAGLPAPSIYAPQPVRRGGWRWLVFAGAVWMALPFLLVGLVLAVVGREIGAVIFALPALVWVALFWRWARSHSR
jgi:hypothetical protein